MGSNDDRSSKSAGARGAGRLPAAAPEPSDSDALSRELRELHDRYGDCVEIPGRLVDLARRVAEAYAGLDRQGPDRQGPDHQGPDHQGLKNGDGAGSRKLDD